MLITIVLVTWLKAYRQSEIVQGHKYQNNRVSQLLELLYVGEYGHIGLVKGMYVHGSN